MTKAGRHFNDELVSLYIFFFFLYSKLLMSHVHHKTQEIAAAIFKWPLVAPFMFKISYLHNNTA